MPKGYVILTEAITDPAAMNAYGRAAAPSILEGGASVLAVDPQPQVIEGEWHGDQTVILEFPSVEAARAWYESAAYEDDHEGRGTEGDARAHPHRARPGVDQGLAGGGDDRRPLAAQALRDLRAGVACLRRGA